MARIALVFVGILAFIVAANAESPQPQQQPHQLQALQLMLQREMQAHTADLAAALQLQQQLTAAEAQLDALKKSSAPKAPSP